MRWRVTLRGDGTEIRGYFGGSVDDLAQFAEDVRTWAFVIASPANDDYDPFAAAVEARHAD